MKPVVTTRYVRSLRRSRVRARCSNLRFLARVYPRYFPASEINVIWDEIKRLREEGSTVIVATNEVYEAEILRIG